MMLPMKPIGTTLIPAELLLAIVGCQKHEGSSQGTLRCSVKAPRAF
jgi:hypothetical protein